MVKDKNTKRGIIVGVVIILVLIAFYFVSKRETLPIEKPGPQVVCTLDVKLCPDGSYVGRTGPNCEFSPCPGSIDVNQQTYDDEFFSFRYPTTLGTTYIETFDWPPKPVIVPGPFSCLEAGNETARAGETQLVSVSGRSYCVRKVTEGAAGSIYTRYAFITPILDDVVALTFSIRSPQCANYDEPKRGECEAEKSSFDINLVIDQIFVTLGVK